MLLAVGCVSAPIVEEGSPAESAPLPPAPAISTGTDVLERMRSTHAGGWYETLSFTQENTLYLTTGSEQSSEWRQRISLPGKLRVDYMPRSSRSGVLYEGGRIHVFDNGRRLSTQRGINSFLLLTGDVYATTIQHTASALDSLGVDLSVIHSAEWEGRPVWVVGAVRGDSASPQFWVDAERFVLLRFLEGGAAGGAGSEVRISRFTTVEGMPLPAEVLRLRNGRVVFRESYRDFRVDEPIPPSTFDPARWTEAAGVPAG
jgi:hypothetical protein